MTGSLFTSSRHHRRRHATVARSQAAAPSTAPAGSWGTRSGTPLPTAVSGIDGGISATRVGCRQPEYRETHPGPLPELLSFYQARFTIPTFDPEATRDVMKTLDPLLIPHLVCFE